MHPTKQAAELGRLGFRVLPTHNKIPSVEGFGAENPEATWGPEWFGDAGAGVAVLTGPCPALAPDHLLVLDLDGPAFEDPTIDELLTVCGPTLTSHGGRHLFFRVPPSAQRDRLKQWVDVLGTKALAGAAVDLKWCGGYSCEQWDWEQTPTVEAIAELPMAALDMLIEAGTAGEEERTTSPRPRSLESDDTVADAAEWLCQSAPVAKEGSGHDTLMVVFGALLVGFGLEDATALDLAIEFYNPRCQPPWEGDELETHFQHKIDQINLHGSETWQPLELAKRAEWARAELPSAGAAPVVVNQKASVGGSRFPTEDASGCQMNPLSGWPYILQKGTNYWLHSIGKAAYEPRVEYNEVLGWVNRRLFNQVAESCRTIKDLQSYYLTPLSEVQPSYLVRDNTYDPETNTLTEACLKWTKRNPKFHSGIDAWLRALAGSAYPKLAQWLAALTDLGRPAPALYLIGPKELGKGLLADGIARLWSENSPGSLKETVGDFNPKLQTCPLVFGDEGFPDKFNFDWFREAITRHDQRVNSKNRQQFNILGCARFMLAANNAEALRYQRVGNLEKDDLDAIAARLLVIRCQPEAAATVRQLDTNAAAHHEIAEHILWLASTVPLRPAGERMAAAPGGGDELLGNLTAAKYGEILEVIGMTLDVTEDGQDRAAVCFWPDQWVPSADPKNPGGPAENELWVSVSNLNARLRQIGSRATLADVRSFCNSYHLRAGVHQHLIMGKHVKIRSLDLIKVLDALEKAD